MNNQANQPMMEIMRQNPSQMIVDSSSSKLTGLDTFMQEKKRDTSILLDREERELVKKGDEVTKQEMWDLLESKRFSKLQESAVNLQGDLIFNQRCPKCTLQPPCNHYQNSEDIIQDASKLLQTKTFKQYMSPKKISGLMNVIKESYQRLDTMDLSYRQPMFND